MPGPLAAAARTFEELIVPPGTASRTAPGSSELYGNALEEQMACYAETGVEQRLVNGTLPTHPFRSPLPQASAKLPRRETAVLGDLHDQP
jgi:hypothetical protein